MLVLQWVEIVAAANAIKDNCLLPHSGGWGGSIKLGLDNRVEVKLSTYSEKGKSKKEEGGIIEVAEPGKGSSRMTRLQAIRDILRKADSATLSGIEHILHAQPGHPPPRDGGEANTCRDTSSCGIAAGCVYEQVINSAVVYGSTLIKKVGHCISLSNLLQDFLSVLETKG